MRLSRGVSYQKNIITVERKLPYGKLVYVSVLLSCILFLVGGTAIIFAMASFFLARRSEKIYRQDPTTYSNFSKIKKGKIISIIGIVLYANYFVCYNLDFIYYRLGHLVRTVC
jgi:hypothetical protein